MLDLGRLERVDLRTVWSNEATGFTPWLATEANLTLLAESIGLDLAVERVEQRVGPYRADILCKAVGSMDHWVLVENQIERTDHLHLGQLMTYAAGLHTATIVWIAQRFTDEHRAALDWLNEVTIGEISFFGLEIELWQISGSPPAPKFNVVCSPNQFVKSSQSERSQPSARGELYLQYWTDFRDYVSTHSTELRCLKPQGEYWMDLSPLGPGIRLRAMAGARDKFNMVDLVIYNDEDKSKIEQLLQKRQQVEAVTGPLYWRRKDGYRESAIELRVDGPDPNDRDDWPRQHAWMLDSLHKLFHAFAPLVKNLA